jgi:hypothetical protein
VDDLIFSHYEEYLRNISRAAIKGVAKSQEDRPVLPRLRGPLASTYPAKCGSFPLYLFENCVDGIFCRKEFIVHAVFKKWNSTGTARIERVSLSGLSAFILISCKDLMGSFSLASIRVISSRCTSNHIARKASHILCAFALVCIARNVFSEAMGPEAGTNTSFCGNAILEPGEACDEGANNGDNPNTCRLNCTSPECGDGIIDTLHNEECESALETGLGLRVCDDCRYVCPSNPDPSLLPHVEFADTIPLPPIPLSVISEHCKIDRVYSHPAWGGDIPPHVQVGEPIPTNSDAYEAAFPLETNTIKDKPGLGVICVFDDNTYSFTGQRSFPLNLTNVTEVEVLSPAGAHFDQATQSVVVDFDIDMARASRTHEVASDHHWINHGDYTVINFTDTLEQEQTLTVKAKGECGEETISARIFVNGQHNWRKIIHLNQPSPIALSFLNVGIEQIPSTLASFQLSPAAQAPFVVWYGSSETPVLVWDPEHTGKIKDGRQLFGTWTHGKAWKNGFEPLQELDLDKSGSLEGEELSGIRLWYDANRNAVSEPGEVKDLAFSKVTKILTTFTHDSTLPLYGVRFLSHSKGFEFANSDGSSKSGLVFDWFQPENPKRYWEDSLKDMKAQGYRLLEVTEIPRWEGNKNSIDGYLAFRVDKESSVVEGFYLSASYSMFEGTKQYALFKQDLTGILNPALKKLEFTTTFRPGPSLVLKRHYVIPNFSSLSQSFSGKLQVKVSKGKEQIEEFGRDLALEPISSKPDFAS